MTPPPLPPGWALSPCQDGAVELRVAAGGRRYLVVAGAIVFVGWTSAVLAAAIERRPMPLAADPRFAVLLAALIGVFTLWCALADERWRLSPGVVEHRVGVRRWARVRRIEDRTATLTIAVGHSTNFSTPFFRLYAVAAGRRHFLIERDLGDLKVLAAFIASCTGWALDG